MSPAKSVAFVLVPGAHCLPIQYQQVVEKLWALGHTVEPVHLPTVGRAFFESNGRVASVYDDAAFVSSIIASLADAGHNVVAVGSSYGGLVITEAAKGLTEAERKAAGKAEGGALVRLVYLASLLPEVGKTLGQLVAGKIPVPVSEEIETDFLDPPPPQFAGQILCSDLADAEEQAKWGATLDVLSSRVYSDVINYAGWRTVPTIFVAVLRDKAIEPNYGLENVDGAIEALKAEGQPATVKKVALEADHLMMISQPDKVVEILLEAANSD